MTTLSSGHQNVGFTASARIRSRTDRSTSTEAEGRRPRSPNAAVIRPGGGTTMQGARDMSRRRPVKVLVGLLAVAITAAALLAATATGGTAAKTISVAIVANPQMQ